MKAIISVYLGEMEEIYRKIVVDYDIRLSDLCEYIIISMNGSKIPFYSLFYKKVKYCPNDFDDEESIYDYNLSDLHIKKGDSLELDYKQYYDYFFKLNVDSVENGTNTNEFEVIDGAGYGVLDSVGIDNLKSLIENKYRKNYHLKVDQKNYLKMSFDIDENNNKIREYIKYREELTRPKRYVFNVSLDEFDKEIKRKIIINADESIDTFCRKIIVSMKGDLSYPYKIKCNKDYLDDEYFYDVPLYYLDLKEKQRLKVIHNPHDFWIFNVTVSKIIDGYGEYNSEVISGKGYGIVDDCGGVDSLDEIFQGKSDVCRHIDINQFNLEECNKEVQNTL